MTSLQKKILGLFVISVSDAVLTVYLITKGFGEANPILNWYMNITCVSTMAITKIIVTLILLFMIYRTNSETTEKYINWAIPLYLFILFGGVLFQGTTLIGG